MCKHACAKGVWGHALPGKLFKIGALRLLLRPYLYPNATSLTRIPGRSRIATVHISFHRNSFYFVLHFEKSSFVPRPLPDFISQPFSYLSLQKRSQKSPRLYNSLKGGGGGVLCCKISSRGGMCP